MFFNVFFRHADVVKMANLAQMVNVIAPIMTNREGLFLQPTYFPLVEYGRQRGFTSLDVWVSGPTFSLDKRPPLQYLDVSSTFDPKTRRVFVNVLNRSRDRGITARIESQQGRPRPDIGVWHLYHDDLKATHGFGDDLKVRPTIRSARVDVDGGSFSWTFPKHSLTILELRLE